MPRKRNYQPINLGDYQTAEIDEMMIAEWTPLPNGAGKPTQVHLVLKVAGFEHPMVMRFKTRKGATLFIQDFTHHVDRVWPKED